MTRSRLISVTSLCAGLMAIGAVSAQPAQPAAVDADRQSNAVSTATPRNPGAGAPDFERIVAQHGPAVVNISVTSGLDPAASDGSPPPFGGNPFGFGPFGRGNPGPGAPQQPVRGMGSGFILSPDGLIITNAHVVENASEVTVKLVDRREFRAKVLGTDPLTDVAVLKIDADKLPSVRLGKVEQLNVGEWVLAIGSPFGFENSATVGVVSAKRRALPGVNYVPFIQTDVAVNPGNSGGPLFNARGEVVGVNSVIYSRTGGYQGLSFAIPIDVALRIKDQIVATGQAQHGRLGVGIQEVTQTLADALKLGKPEGAIVTNVEPGGPADRAGLKAGDVIRKVDGQPVVASADLPAVVGMLPPGQQVTLDVWRNGDGRPVNVTLGSLGGTAVKAKGGGADKDPRLGLTVRPVEVGEGPKGAGGGLLVQDASGPAARAGVRPGDVVLRVNDSEVGTVEDVRKALEGAGDTVALLIQRGDARLYVPVRIG